jgi:hypothetical protein
MKSQAIKKKGVIRDNNVITLKDEVGLPVGTIVEVQIKVVPAPSKVDRSVFGLWKDRADLEDSRRWVRELREKKWRRSSSTAT